MQLHLDKQEKKTDYTELETGHTLYVHLCSGKVVEVSPATAVRVTADSVVALNGKKTAATFPRDDVYFAADEPMEPPSLE
jgi:hypothetical protein